MATTIAYVATLACVLFALTTLLQSLFGGIIGRFTNTMIGSFIGSVLCWLLINFLWVKFEGEQLPILVMVLSLGILLTQGGKNSDGLTEHAKTMMAAEMWGIIAVGIYVLIDFGLRWY